MIRVNPPIPLETDKGWGWAHFVTDDGLETSLLWTVFLEDGKIYQVPNELVRACTNYSAGRSKPEKP